MKRGNIFRNIIIIFSILSISCSGGNNLQNKGIKAEQFVKKINNEEITLHTVGTVLDRNITEDVELSVDDLKKIKTWSQTNTSKVGNADVVTGIDDIIYQEEEQLKKINENHQDWDIEEKDEDKEDNPWEEYNIIGKRLKTERIIEFSKYDSAKASNPSQENNNQESVNIDTVNSITKGTLLKGTVVKYSLLKNVFKTFDPCTKSIFPSISDPKDTFYDRISKNDLNNLVIGYSRKENNLIISDILCMIIDYYVCPIGVGYKTSCKEFINKTCEPEYCEEVFSHNNLHLVKIITSKTDNSYKVKISNYKTGKLLLLIENWSCYPFCKFSPDGSKLLLGDDHHLISLNYDKEKGLFKYDQSLKSNKNWDETTFTPSLISFNKNVTHLLISDKYNLWVLDTNDLSKPLYTYNIKDIRPEEFKVEAQGFREHKDQIEEICFDDQNNIEVICKNGLCNDSGNLRSCKITLGPTIISSIYKLD